MSKSLYIAEKPSVASEFAKALNLNVRKRDGYMESEEAVITWCVGHLVTMSYPDRYDEKYKRWSLDTLPFLPKDFKYEIIPNVEKQFRIVKALLNREDIGTIYVCTDSGREGEYIYRLVEQMSGITGKLRKRVWIDSQTQDEILRGIKEAKDLSEYDNLSAAAYLRAKEDYLMGINFSRLLTLKYGRSISNYLKIDRAVLSVGRVMTCVLGMVVRREREIRSFVKTPFYRVIASIDSGKGGCFEGEWHAVQGSKYFESPYLYKENGFKKRETAEALVASFDTDLPLEAEVHRIEKKKENKNPPLLFNLAELQNECSRLFKISPDETLKIAQELYEKKLCTYPRTDARVLSTAVAKDIHKNISGLKQYTLLQHFAEEVLENESYKNIKSRYVNDKQITDHYAIIPTGQGLSALNALSPRTMNVYEIIVRRFLSIFYPPAVYQKITLITKAASKDKLYMEYFFTNAKLLVQQGYLKVTEYSFIKKKTEEKSSESEDQWIQTLQMLKKGDKLNINKFSIKEGETSPPKRYHSGSIILAMENAGQLIEDEELRAQIKGSGIGTSATRAEILKKLIHIEHLKLNKKTQVITPTQMGEMVFDVVDTSIKALLNPELTASWEKGLTYVSEGKITTEEYMQKLESFIMKRTNLVLSLNNQGMLRKYFDATAVNYPMKGK